MRNYAELKRKRSTEREKCVLDGEITVEEFLKQLDEMIQGKTPDNNNNPNHPERGSHHDGKTAKVLTAWIDDSSNDEMRLTTVHVDD